MDADRRPNLRPQRFDALGLRRLRGVAALEDDKRAEDAGRLRPGDDLIEIAAKLLVGQMTVRIDHDLEGTELAEAAVKHGGTE